MQSLKLVTSSKLLGLSTQERNFENAYCEWMENRELKDIGRPVYSTSPCEQ
jgi:hypothetical protein